MCLKMPKKSFFFAQLYALYLHKNKEAIEL